MRIIGQSRMAERRAGDGFARRVPAMGLLLALLGLICSGCMLMSGQETTIDVADGTGNVLTRFVSAEGGEEALIDVGLPAAEVQVIAIVGVDSGDLELTLLQPDGAAAFTVASRPDTEVTRSGGVRTDEEGRLRYRVSARGARDGSYQIFVQP